jgi:hypothetical protein
MPWIYRIDLVTVMLALAMAITTIWVIDGGTSSSSGWITLVTHLRRCGEWWSGVVAVVVTVELARVMADLIALRPLSLPLTSLSPAATMLAKR